MKTLGIIGGTGPESTIEYYRRLIAAYQKRLATDHVPALIINSIDYRKLVDWFGAGKLGAVTDLLVGEIGRLQRAGADFALIAANTPHLVLDDIRPRVQIPLLSIVEATADAAAARGLKRLALFGTRFTMQSTLFQEPFARRDMAIVLPDSEEQEFIHQKYMDELVVGTVLDETRAALLAILEKMKQDNEVDGLILGGTELSLILREATAAGLPVLDTTEIHVDAAIDWMLRA